MVEDDVCGNHGTCTHFLGFAGIFSSFDDRQPHEEERNSNNNKSLDERLWDVLGDGCFPSTTNLGCLIPQQQQQPENPQEIVDRAARVMEEPTVSLHDQGSVLTDSIKTDGALERHEDDGYSWDDSDAAPQHYDAWEVLHDEYAKDFGFNYEENRDAQDANNRFHILGTGPEDHSARPHVLSPPLMDSIMTFLPESIQNQNYWLKYSLIRDGASLDTLKHYVRGASRTVLAIETTDGQVFGSFTSSPWRNPHSEFYGSGETFLWKMRQSRQTPSSSLIDQARLETEIDVYFYSGINNLIQLCTGNMIAVGGGKLTGCDEEEEDDEFNTDGFGLAVQDDLLHGTSSPCATFRNPSLVNHSATVVPFQIANLEVWTLTPCETVDLAQKMEMISYFRSKSQLTLRKQHDLSGSGYYETESMVQGEFYRRIGDLNKGQRNQWRCTSSISCSGNAS